MDLVAVVGEDDVHEVLANVVDVALDRPDDDDALAAGIGLLEVGLEVRDRGLHGLGALEHERQLHLAPAEEFTHHLHAFEQHVVDDRERAATAGEGFVEFAGDAVSLAVDDPMLQPFFDGPAGTIFLLDCAGFHALEEVEEFGQRVVVVRTPVVDEIERDLACPVVDLVHRHDARGVRDRRIKACLATLVEEHAVQHVADCRLESEAHVREAEDRGRARQLGGHAPDGLDRLDAVTPEFVLARPEREGQHVEDQVGRVDAVLLGGERVDALADAQLPIGVTGLALFVDREADDGRAVFTRQAEDAVESGTVVLAVFEVGGVEDRLPARVLQPGLEHLRLGGVEDQRQCSLGGEAGRDLVHVLGAVTADVVHAHVEHVRAFLHLVACHLHARVPVRFEHGVAEFARSVRVRTFTDRQVRELLVIRHVGVHARTSRLEHRRAGDGSAVVPEPLHDRGEVLGGRAATAADDVESELADEPLVRVRKEFRREVVVRAAVHHRGQSRVRQAREERAAVLREIAQVFGHLDRTRRAVEAEDVGAHRLEGGDRGADLGPDEHAARGLHRDLHHQRQLGAGIGHRPPARHDRGLGLQQVIDGLDEEHVRTTGDEAGGLLLVVVAERVEADGTE